MIIYVKKFGILFIFFKLVKLSIFNKMCGLKYKKKNNIQFQKIILLIVISLFIEINVLVYNSLNINYIFLIRKYKKIY